MIYECYRPTREMLRMKPAELRAYLAEGDDLAGLDIPLEVSSIGELRDIYRLSPKEFERIENALKRQSIYVCEKFVIRSVNRKGW